MTKIITQDAAARLFNVHPRTISRWLGEGFIVGYRAGVKDVRVDADDIETQLRVNPKMRDGRRPYGPRARIVPMPVRAEVVPPTVEAVVPDPSEIEAEAGVQS